MPARKRTLKEAFTAQQLQQIPQPPLKKRRIIITKRRTTSITRTNPITRPRIIAKRRTTSITTKNHNSDS